jgi:hypothetical protein
LPVSETGATSEEPAVTRVVTAGSVVLCDSLRFGADACGVAFRVARHAGDDSDGFVLFADAVIDRVTKGNMRMKFVATASSNMPR